MDYPCSSRRRHVRRFREALALVVGWVLWAHGVLHAASEFSGRHESRDPMTLQKPHDIPIIAWGGRAHARARMPFGTGFMTWDSEENWLDREDLDLGLLNLGTSRASTPISK